MNTNLLFDFTVDKSQNSIFVSREFAADLSLVWAAFTQQELLDQWGAPKPWSAQTISMEFKEGGRRFYKMVGPDGQEHYSVQDFQVISPMHHLEYLSGFSDKDETINPDFYGTVNTLNFSESNGVTTVRITLKYTSPEILGMMVEKGFKEGFTMTLENLDELLEKLSA